LDSHPLGDVDKAFEWLEKAYDERSGYIIGALSDFGFRRMQSDPRAQAFKKKLRLEIS
jgi:hypothetical protein